MSTGYRLLYFYRGEGNSPEPVAATLADKGWAVDQVAVSDFAPLWGVIDVFRHRNFSNYDMVVGCDYFLAWAVCVRLLLTCKPLVAAVTFNQSRRLILSGIHPLDWLLNRIWRRAALFIVHSNAEAAIFTKLHDIPMERFEFCYWGYDLPAHDRAQTKLPSEPYVSMIGRNNRDISTFCAAVERAGVGGVLITASYMLKQQPVIDPGNVLLLTDRPLEECLNYVAGSFAHLVLVVDAARGAGHISAVSAMHLGKPQIFSDVAPLSDYLKDGFNGIAVGIADIDAVANAIVELRDNRGLRERLGRNGQRFASEKLSYSASTNCIIEALVRLASHHCKSLTQ